MTNKYTWEEQKKIVKDYFKLIRKKTMTTDKEIIEKIVKWLELNIEAPYLELVSTDLITDNKNLLRAIKDWKNDHRNKKT